MAQAISLTALASSLGDYMRKNTDRLIQEFYMQMQSTSIFEVLPEIKDQFPLVPMSVGEIVQPNPLTAAWNPTNNAIAFAPRILTVRNCKVDLEIIPQALHKSWLGHMAKAGAADNTEAAIPFEQFIMSNIINAAKRDIEKEAIWRGVYNGSGTAAADCMDGLLTIISDDIGDSTIAAGNVATTGATTSSNAVDNFEAVFAKVPNAMRNEPLLLLASPTLTRYYEQDYRATFGSLPYNQQFKKTVLDGSNCEVVPVPGFGDSQAIVIVTKNDQVKIGVDTESDIDQIDVEKALRKLNVMMSFRIGIQYSKPAEVWANNYPDLES